MKILVYDVAAQDGGGLFVLTNFYHDVKRLSPENIEWIFVVSQDGFANTEKIQIQKYTSPKKSWLHRLSFEYFEFPKILKREKPDLVISLQNMPVKRYSGKQFTYLHQSLQYCPKRYSFLKKEERGTAIRQHIICGFIKNALPQSDHIFVQTNWIKEATQKWIACAEDKITVVPVEMKKPEIEGTYTGLETRSFFYPARAEMYKNHSVIIEACKILKEKGVSDFKVLLTINDDNAYAEELKKDAEGLPIEFIGQVSYKKIWDYYRSSVLLFPSYLETCGLPLLEARAVDSWIIVADMPYAHEALDGYKNLAYFNYTNSQELADRMRAVLDKKVIISADRSDSRQSISLVEAMLKEIENENFMADKHTVSV